VEACERLRGLRAPIPEDMNIALWIDYSCIDQDSAPAEELEERMAALIGVCDLVLTPIEDHAGHESWSLPIAITNGIEDYKAAAWQEYWRRAWCRVEAFLAAAVPVEHEPTRVERFRGGIRTCKQAARRPHAIFGTKELAHDRPPLFIPSLVGATFLKYAPEHGDLTSEADRSVIALLTATARAELHEIDRYWGGTDGEGRPHGVGKQMFEDGSSYEGEWVHGVQHGHGVNEWAWGDRYDGQWADGKMHGKCVHTYADGGRFEGLMQFGVREGTGRFQYHFGDTYEGMYSNDLKVAGVWHYANGAARVCRWELHESGSYSVIKGEGAKWAADRHVAWRLLDGEEEEEVPVSEANAIALRLGGFVMPAAADADADADADR